MVPLKQSRHIFPLFQRILRKKKKIGIFFFFGKKKK